MNNPELDFDGDDGLPDVPGPIGEALGTVRAFTPDGQLIAEFPLRNDFPDGGFQTGDNLQEFTFSGPVARIELINAGDAGSFADIAKITASAIPDQSPRTAVHSARKGSAGDAAAVLMAAPASPTSALSQPTVPAPTTITTPLGAPVSLPLDVTSVDRLFASSQADHASLVLPSAKHATPAPADAGLADVLHLDSSSI
jgi:hypothetical protein